MRKQGREESIKRQVKFSGRKKSASTKGSRSEKNMVRYRGREREAVIVMEALSFQKA